MCILDWLFRVSVTESTSSSVSQNYSTDFEEQEFKKL